MKIQTKNAKRSKKGKIKKGFPPKNRKIRRKMK